MILKVLYKIDKNKNNKWWNQLKIWLKIRSKVIKIDKVQIVIKLTLSRMKTQ